MTAPLDLGLIPLNIGTRTRPSNAPFPDELPFTAQVDDRTGVIRQAFDPRVAALLDEVYARGSQLGTPMSDSGLGKATCEDFLGFLRSALGLADLRGMKVLEVGCGTGYLLAQMQALGAEVLGIEPGASSSLHADSAGIPVIHEPFERVELKDEFDLVIHTGVLEHVRTPADFLRVQLSALRPGGRIVLAVPDCEPPLAHGDLSMFAHEHWSYFTRESLEGLARDAGGRILHAAGAGVGGAVYVVIGAGACAPDLPMDRPGAADEFEAFRARVAAGNESLQQYFAGRKAKSIGVYCPGRFLNYWKRLGAPSLRCFDDDPSLHGRFFPPLPAAVESRRQLLERPVGCLLIMSRTFGTKIAETLGREASLARTEILTVSDLF